MDSFRKRGTLYFPRGLGDKPIRCTGSIFVRHAVPVARKIGVNCCHSGVSYCKDSFPPWVNKLCNGIRPANAPFGRFLKGRRAHPNLPEGWKYTSCVFRGDHHVGNILERY